MYQFQQYNWCQQSPEILYQWLNSELKRGLTAESIVNFLAYSIFNSKRIDYFHLGSLPPHSSISTQVTVSHQPQWWHLNLSSQPVDWGENSIWLLEQFGQRFSSNKASSTKSLDILIDYSFLIKDSAHFWFMLDGTFGKADTPMPPPRNEDLIIYIIVGYR